MIIEKLNENNLMLYATKCYDNPDPNVGTQEFNKDIKILVHIKKLLNKYINTGELKVQLLINHIVILNNLFGATATARMLFFYCDPQGFPALKTVMSWMDIIPDEIPEVKLKNVEIDNQIIQHLREI